MKKAFDQTFREIKRGVNKKVLKVPGIEQKVLDATSNELWGPHGSLLADIAQASRSQFEYQMIMSLLWKRLNDTGKNWRHVYKALIVLEFMVAHGSERVIDDIREHAYQISTLSDFQYIDSSGKDQGNNVRKKSQFLVALVNDKERIQEARQKAAANRDKYRQTPKGGMYRPSSFSGTGGYGDRNDDDRYEGRYGNDDRNGYDREREWSNRDDDRHGRHRDSYGRDEKDSYDRYSRDDDYRGRSRSVDDFHYTSRSRSHERDRDRAYEDERQDSYRGSGAKADNRSPDGSFPGKPLQRKFSEQNLAPPSYEEAVGDARSPARSERGGETSAASAPKTSTHVGSNLNQVPQRLASPPHISSSSGQVAPTVATSTPAPSVASFPPPSAAAAAPAPENQEGNGFDEFDPRGSYSGISTPSKGSAEVDFFGSLSDSLAIVPVTPLTSAPEDYGSSSFSPAPSFAAASTAPNQSFEDPFGDGPFRVSTGGCIYQQPQNAASTSTTHQMHNNAQQYPLSNAQLPLQRSQSLPQASYPTQPPSQYAHSGFPAQTEPPHSLTGFMAQPSQPVQAQPGTNFYGNYYNMQQQQQSGATSGPSPLYNSNPLARTSSTPLFQNTTSSTHQPPAAGGSLALVPQPAKDKFEMKSTVWADTLSRGLVDLNISGPKTNPMSNIGIDFEALNRKEKRMEKPSAAGSSLVSSVSMGKAMGSGTGMGRAGAGALRPPQSPMVGGGSGVGMRGGYGGMNNQPPMMNMGMGMNNSMPMNMNMNMNMGMGMMRPSGPHQMQQPGAGYNPIGGGAYAPQQPYGGYR